MVSVFIEGLLLQGSLIFALGAQNIFILESGLKRQNHVAVSFTCYLCDFALIMIGVIGAGTLFTTFPEIKIIFGVLGVFFLFTYGYGKIRSRGEEFIFTESTDRPHDLKKNIMAAITFSVINPHAFIDGIVLIGGYSAKYDDLTLRISLGMGASTYSLLWFLALSTASSKMIPLFRNPRRMQLLMSVAGFFLIFLSAKLSVDVYSWVKEAFDQRKILDTFALLETGSIIF
jgi:L-lysine exporter family protein LysE/ArgO